jgi:hypothetical protein
VEDEPIRLVAGDSVMAARDRLPDYVQRVQRETFWADSDALGGKVGKVIQRPYTPGEFYECGDEPEEVTFAETVTVEVWLHDMFHEPGRGLIRMRQPLPGPDIVVTDGEDSANWIVREGRQ